MIEAIYKCDTCGGKLEHSKLISGGFGTEVNNITVGTYGTHHFCQSCADKISWYIQRLNPNNKVK